jgi:hypothetical protein
VLVSDDSDQDKKSYVERTVDHEETLINTRLTWMLTFQGFLFAALSLANEDSRLALFSVIPWIGIAVAALSFLGVLAAYGRIDAARRKHRGQGFGSTCWPKWLGRTNSLGIPVVIVTAWTILYIKLA